MFSHGFMRRHLMKSNKLSVLMLKLKESVAHPVMLWILHSLSVSRIFLLLSL